MGQLRRFTIERAQKGAALLLMLLLFIIAFSTYMVSSLSATQPEVQRQQKTMETLMYAKEALIAWPVLQGNFGKDTYHRPGSLPCPDNNHKGAVDSGNESGTCASGGSSIGRFPWKSFGIEELGDANGEMLWYAVSDNFRKTNMNKKPINSDAQGNLLLYAADGITLLTPPGEELVAIIFSPGPPLSGQNRSSAPNDASSYLDNGNGRNNVLAGGPFIAGPALNAQGNIVVNDQVIGIGAQELIAAVEKLVLNEAQKALNQFALNPANGGKYPNPARFDDPECNTIIVDVRSPNVCSSDSSTCIGRLPEDSGDTTKLGSYLPDWFLQNGWGRVITYAVNSGSVVDSSGANCSSPLKVDGQDKTYVIIAPGMARNGQVRPSTTLSNYLEDAANSDAWTSLDVNFVTPGSNSNDQLRSSP